MTRRDDLGQPIRCERHEGRAVAWREKAVRVWVERFLAVCIAAVIACALLLHYENISPVRTKAKDPSFVSSAEASGYKVEVENGFPSMMVLTCTRGPSSPCGPAEAIEGGLPRNVSIR